MIYSILDRIKEFIRDYNSWERKAKREREGFSPASSRFLLSGGLNSTLGVA